MNTQSTLQSFIADRWLGKESAQPLLSAVNGDTVAHTHAERIDFEEACSMRGARVFLH